MKFCKEFIELMNDPFWEGKYIGEGNPNASILIVGQESAIDQYPDTNDGNSPWLLQLYNNNFSLWENNIDCLKQRNQISIENWPSQTSLRLEIFNPLSPYYGQKFSLKHNHEGTSKTWYNYQKIINAAPREKYKVKPAEKYSLLTIFDNCFLTELNDFCIPNHKKETYEKYSSKIGENVHDVIESHIGARYDLICNHDHGFFKKFDVIILACGEGYLKKLDISKMFGDKTKIRINQASRLSDQEIGKLWEF